MRNTLFSALSFIQTIFVAIFSVVLASFALFLKRKTKMCSVYIDLKCRICTFHLRMQLEFSIFRFALGMRETRVAANQEKHLIQNKKQIQNENTVFFFYQFYHVRKLCASLQFQKSVGRTFLPLSFWMNKNRTEHRLDWHCRNAANNERWAWEKQKATRDGREHMIEEEWR